MKGIVKKSLCAVLTIALAVSLAVGLAACNNDENTEANTLIVGTTTQITSLNRLNASTNEPGYSYDVLSATVSQAAPIYSGGDGNYYPLLCSFNANADSTEWTFTVQDGYTWHDGAPVSADDLKFTMESQFNAEDYVAINRSADNKSVTVVYEKSNPRILNKFTTLRTMPAHLLRDETKETLSDEKSVVGCGPFKFSKWDKNSNTLEFVKYDAYPQADKLAFDKVIFKTFDTSDVMDLALKAGEIDMEYNYARGISTAAEADFADEDNIKLEGYSSGANPMNLFFNDKKVTDVRIRKAVQKAIDYSTLRRLFGTSFVTASNQGFVPSTVFGYIETPTVERDLEGAKTLLSQAGFSASNKYAFELSVRSDGVYSEVAKRLKTDLEQTGMISVSIVSSDSASFNTKVRAGNHQAVLAAITPGGMEMEGGLATKYFLDTLQVPFGQLAQTDDQGNKTAFGTIMDSLYGAETMEAYMSAAALFQNYCVDRVPGIALYNDSLIQAYSTKLSGTKVDGVYGLLSIKGFETLKKAR